MKSTATYVPQSMTWHQQNMADEQHKDPNLKHMLEHLESDVHTSRGPERTSHYCHLSTVILCISWSVNTYFIDGRQGNIKKSCSTPVTNKPGDG